MKSIQKIHLCRGTTTAAVFLLQIALLVLEMLLVGSRVVHPSIVTGQIVEVGSFLGSDGGGERHFSWVIDGRRWQPLCSVQIVRRI